MSVVKWNPWREVAAMQAALHGDVDRLFSRFGGFPEIDGGEVNGRKSWMLPTDIIESGDNLKLKAALPGVDPKDISVEVDGNTLTISAQRRFEDKVEKDQYHWIEQQYGSFTRSLTLPKSADTAAIEANYHNGVLELTIPKLAAAKPRRIELNTGEKQIPAIEAGTVEVTNTATAEAAAAS